MGRFPSITHPFAARRQDCSRVTARLACVKHAASVQSEPGSNSSLKGIELLSMSKSKAHCWTFGHSVFAPKASTQVPTQVICQIIKERRGRIGPKQGAGSIALGHIPSTTAIPRLPHPEPRAAPGSGARSIAAGLALSTRRSNEENPWRTPEARCLPATPKAPQRSPYNGGDAGN